MSRRDGTCGSTDGVGRRSVLGAWGAVVAGGLLAGCSQLPVGQDPTTTVDDFEDGELTPYEVGDSGTVELLASGDMEPAQGTLTLAGTSNDRGHAARAWSRPDDDKPNLPAYPEPGDTLGTYVAARSQNGGAKPAVGIGVGPDGPGNHHLARLNVGKDRIEIQTNGQARTVATAERQLEAGTWYWIEFERSTDGTLTLSVFEAPDGDPLNVLSASVEDDGHAGILWFADASTNAQETSYFDGARLL